MGATMPATKRDMQRSGALTAIIIRYHRCKGKKTAWKEVEEWCRREFPDCSPQSLAAVIKQAKAAVDLGRRITRSAPSRLFDTKAERKRQGE